MNTRIQELAIEAGYDWAWDTQIDFGHKEMEKFAELIVAECIGIADEYDGAGSTIVSRIKQHFGVEE